jgi:hypothetical protein
MADLASIAAANTAGYSETVNDKGATYPDSTHRFTVTLEKFVRGALPATAVFRSVRTVRAPLRPPRRRRRSPHSTRSAHIATRQPASLDVD